MAKKSNSPITGVAMKIFRLQKQTGGAVPGHVMAAARRIIQGGGSKADENICRGYLGISRSGASGMSKENRFYNSAISSAGQLASGLDLLSRGNVGGAAQVASSMQRTVSQIVKSKEFENALQIAATTLVSGGDKAAGILKGTRAAYAVRRGVRKAGAVATAAAVVGGAVMMGTGFVDSIAGLTQTTAGRRAKQEALLQKFDPIAHSYEDVRLAEKRALAQEIDARSAGNFLFGSFSAHIRKKRYGVDEETLGRRGSLHELRKSGLSSGSKLDDAYKLAHTEALREGFGGESIGRLLNLIGLGARAQGVEASEKVSEQIKRAKELSDQAADAAYRRDFNASSAYIAEANKEVPGSIPAWIKPQVLWKAQEGSRTAERVWAAANNPRAGARVGD